MWTLILTLVVIGSNPNPTVALTNIPNFPTEASCLSSGNEWIKLQQGLAHESRVYHIHPRALCVQVGQR
jgi:hypothetical protein